MRSQVFGKILDVYALAGVCMLRLLLANVYTGHRTSVLRYCAQE